MFSEPGATYPNSVESSDVCKENVFSRDSDVSLSKDRRSTSSSSSSSSSSNEFSSSSDDSSTSEDSEESDDELRKPSVDSPRENRKKSAKAKEQKNFDSLTEKEREKYMRHRQPVQTASSLNRIRVSRAWLREHLYRKTFTKVIVGCYVRITIGTRSKIAEIVGVAVDSEAYDFENIKTNIWLKLKIGSQIKSFQMIFVSNHGLEENEFHNWLLTMRHDELPICTQEHIRQKHKEICKFSKQNITGEEIRRMVAQKNEFLDMPLGYNLLMIRENLRYQLSNAKRQDQKKQIVLFEKQLAQVNQKLLEEREILSQSVDQAQQINSIRELDRKIESKFQTLQEEKEEESDAVKACRRRQLHQVTKDSAPKRIKLDKNEDNKKKDDHHELISRLVSDDMDLDIDLIDNVVGESLNDDDFKNMPKNGSEENKKNF
ncbi:hypothetical protein SNEBB_007727 [Seison nebaliae]|nr:hypothetical protein SNEBB_007727 [Seison nebaliae]